MNAHHSKPADTQALGEIARGLLAGGRIASMAIFLVQPGAPGLVLGAAAGIEGPPLDNLVAAVRNPQHPIAQTVVDGVATFDVRPMNPGGPALRSHVPLIGAHGAVIGVLAVAHQEPVDAAAREDLMRAAAMAAAAAV